MSRFCGGEIDDVGTPISFLLLAIGFKGLGFRVCGREIDDVGTPISFLLVAIGFKGLGSRV